MVGDAVGGDVTIAFLDHHLTFVLVTAGGNLAPIAKRRPSGWLAVSSAAENRHAAHDRQDHNCREQQSGLRVHPHGRCAPYGWYEKVVDCEVLRSISNP